MPNFVFYVNNGIREETNRKKGADKSMERSVSTFFIL